MNHCFWFHAFMFHSCVHIANSMTLVPRDPHSLAAAVKSNTHQFSVFQITVKMKSFIKSLDDLFNVSGYTFLHMILSMSNRRTGEHSL